MPPPASRPACRPIFREAEGNIHGFINLRKAIPSSDDDIAGCVAALKLMLGEADAQ